MSVEDIKKLIDEGEYGKAGHALFEMAQKPKGGAHTNGGGAPGDDSGNTPPPPPPPGH